MQKQSRKLCQVFTYTSQGLGLTQFADHLANEINTEPNYVEK